MKIFVTVKANAKTNRVEKIDETHLKVSVKAPAKEGQANLAVLEVLSQHFGIPKSRCALLKGHRVKNKVVEVGPIA